MDDPARRSIAKRRLWLLVLVVAVLGTVVSGAFATGLAGGSSQRPGAARTPPHRTAGPEATGTTPRIQPALDQAALDQAALDQAAPMAKSAPTRLRIPAIRVDSSLMALGLKDDGTLETPPGGFPAGWFTGAPTPGELGPAIIVGHVRYDTPGVFARLSDLRRDDAISVRRKDGSTAVFRVTAVEHFAKSAFPTQKVYGNIDHAGLRLITCGGLDAGTNEFEENVVVFADFVSARSRPRPR